MVKCSFCNKESTQSPREGQRCSRCGKELPLPPAGDDFWTRPGEKKRQRRKKKKVAQPVAPVPEPGVSPPPLERPFDYDSFFQKFAQMAIVAGVASVLMLLVFMSIGTRSSREGRQLVEVDKPVLESEPRPVTGKNRPPVFPDQNFTLAGSATSGRQIGTLKAKDPDGDRLTYEIIQNADANRDKQQSVKLNGNLLVVNDAGDFRRQSNAPFKLRARASDGRLHDTANIWVDMKPNSKPTNDLAIKGRNFDTLQKAVGLIQFSIYGKRANGDTGYSNKFIREVSESEWALNTFPFKPTEEIYSKEKKRHLDTWGKFIIPVSGHGTCFVISPDGYAITNAHVVNPHEIVKNQDLCEEFAKSSPEFTSLQPQLIVFLGDRKHHHARVIRKLSTDELDFALIKIEGLADNPFFRLLRSHQINPETKVTTLGYPGTGMEGDIDKQAQLNDAVALSNPFQWWSPFTLQFQMRGPGGTQGRPMQGVTYFPPENFIILHQANIDGGNSGGPLISESGVVVGINTWAHTRSDSVNWSLSTFSIIDVMDELTRKHSDIAVEWVDTLPAGDQ